MKIKARMEEEEWPIQDATDPNIVMAINAEMLYWEVGSEVIYGLTKSYY